MPSSHLVFPQIEALRASPVTPAAQLRTVRNTPAAQLAACTGWLVMGMGMGRPASPTCLPLPVPRSRTRSACLSRIPAPSRGCAWLRPRPRIPQHSPQPAHPNTCSELQIFIAAAAGPRRGLGALRDAARRREGGPPAGPPLPSRGPGCGG